MKSDYFSAMALRAFNRVGDILIPHHGEFPSFSEYGGIEHLDKLVAFTPRDDIRALNVMMTILAFAPKFVLRWLVIQAASSHQSSGILAPAFRKLYLGWWGLIFACYYSSRPGSNYSGKDPANIIGFDLNRLVD